MTTTKKKYKLPEKGYSLMEVLLKTNKFLKSPIQFIEESMDEFGDSYHATLPGGHKIIWTRNPQFIDHVLRTNQRNYPKSNMAIEKASAYFGGGLVFARILVGIYSIDFYGGYCFFFSFVFIF